MRLKFLTGERDVPVPKQDERALPVDFETLPTAKSKARAEEARAANPDAAADNPLSALLGGGLGGGAAGGPGAGGLSPEQLGRVRAIALLRRLLVVVLGVAVSVWPATREDSTPATRLWVHLIPLFVILELVFRRVHHFLGLAPPGLGGALLVFKVAISDFMITFAAFWLAGFFLRDYVADAFGALDDDDAMLLEERAGVFHGK